MNNLLKKFVNRVTKPPEALTVFPEHLAIIMDGNGRWANRRGLPRTAGHRVGLERVRDTVKICLKYRIRYLTLYAFSTENWRRPDEEVNFLMDLFLEALDKEIQELHQSGVKVRFIGLKDRLGAKLVELMDKSEQLTAPNTNLTMNLAINYGGRSEIIAAVKGIGRAVKNGQLDPDLIEEKDFSNRLFTAGQPDPDLLIRPGGEQRISNFLIWQTAYTEFYFSDKYWPEFNETEFLKAFRFYSTRERRFGRVKGGTAVK